MEWRTLVLPFHWFVEFYDIMERGGFQVIIGNPPFVEISSVRNAYSIIGFDTESCGNLFAPVSERALSLGAPSSRLGLVVPLSAFCTQRMQPFRKTLLDATSRNWVSHFGLFPSRLFDGAAQRVSIFLSTLKTDGANPLQSNCWTSRYLRWLSAERESLFFVLGYQLQPSELDLHSNFPKLGTLEEAEMYLKMATHTDDLALIEAESGDFPIYYKNTGVNNWITATSFAPAAWRDGIPSRSSRETLFRLSTKFDQSIVLAVMNSNLFYWFYQLRSNCRDLNPSDIRDFPLPDQLRSAKALKKASDALDRCLDRTSRQITRNQRQTGEIKLQSFQPRLCKREIDTIDALVATAFGFDDSVKDMLVSLDVKYRMGQEGDASDE